jgi:TatD DNase family protein
MKTSPTLIDAHAHLIWPDLLKDIDKIMLNASNAGISHVINAGISIADFDPCLKLGKKYSSIKNIIGIHPESSIVPAEEFEVFKKKFIENQDDFVALGEIGLDFLQIRDKSLRKVQERIFRKQLKLAIELQKPVVIHCRWAEKHAVNILEESQYSDLAGVLLHCFVGADKYINRALEHENWMFTVPTSVYYKKLNQTIASKIPLEKMMLETDAPFLKPKADLKQNEPQYLIYSVEKLSEMKEIAESEIASITTANCRNFFNF